MPHPQLVDGEGFQVLRVVMNILNNQSKKRMLRKPCVFHYGIRFPALLLIVWNTEMQEQWKKSISLPIYKDDTADCNNYQGTSLYQ
jgi:hypothetical protein